MKSYILHLRTISARRTTMFAKQRFRQAMVTALAASFAVAAWPSSAEAEREFQARLREHASQLTIPGIAYAVVRDGKVEAAGSITTEGVPLAPDSALRFASVTKAFTAVLLLRAIEQKKLSLDDSVSKWLPEFADRPRITVRHLAAHVSEGVPGTEYVYGTTRYSRLGDILVKALGAASFEAALRREVIEPAGLEWRDSPGLGAHAALVTTVNDVARFAAALQMNKLISAKSFRDMTTPFVSTSNVAQPVGVGLFSQDVGGERVAWSFGQDDPDYSSALLLMIPRRKLAVVLLANTDELSNPFRLLMGNVRLSPFATAFLDAYAPDLARDISRRDRDISDMLASLSTGDAAGTISRIERLAAREPMTYSNDFGLHFVAGVLAPQLPRGFCESIDANVMAAHPRNRWALLMSGGIQGSLGNAAQAVTRYEALLALPNQERDGLERLFRAWAFAGLASAVRTSDPARAQRYIEEGLATGVTGGTRDSLLDLQKQVSAAAAR
jgi:CubicO group peptidase (beta-lactamase class C family)